MQKQIAPEVDPAGFEAKLAECSSELREIVGYLRATAQHAGGDVTQRRVKHQPPNSGWGVTYYNGTDAFCDVHPKSRSNHAWCLIHGADSSAIAAEGLQPSAQDGWFQISTMREAVRIAKWILWAHDQRPA